VTTLLESKARPYGSKKGAMFSMGLHVVVIGLAVYASGRAMLPEREKLEEHSILFVAPPPPKVHVAPDPIPETKRPPARTPRPVQQQRAPTPPRPAPVQAPRPTPQIAAAPIVAPINIPTSLPPVDLKAIPTVGEVAIPVPPAAREGSGSSSGRTSSNSDGDVGGSGGRGGLGSGASNKAYSENQVERAVVATRPAQPRYPDALKSVNVTGEVVASYIVDARGRVEPGSIKILSATHKLFGDAVRRALLDARFRPAQVGGQSVRQLVEQPFIFKLEGR
jgi:TonB family protein